MLNPGKEWFTGFHLTRHKVVVGGQGFFIHGAHTLHGQRTGIFDFAVSGTLNYPARAKLFAEVGIFRVIRIFRLFFGIQVIEIAKELIETMCSRQEFIAIAKVVLPNCPVA